MGRFESRQHLTWKKKLVTSTFQAFPVQLQLPQVTSIILSWIVFRLLCGCFCGGSLSDLCLSYPRCSLQVPFISLRILTSVMPRRNICFTWKRKVSLTTFKCVHWQVSHCLQLLVFFSMVAGEFSFFFFFFLIIIIYIIIIINQVCVGLWEGGGVCHISCIKIQPWNDAINQNLCKVPSQRPEEQQNWNYT